MLDNSSLPVQGEHLLILSKLSILQSASGLPDKTGVLIVSMHAGSITEKNGLVPGDVIRRINGKDVATVAEMLNALQAIAWQGGAQVNIWHNQQSKDLRIRLK